MNETARRPISQRSTGWAKAITAFCVNANITPNQISGASVVAALIGGAALAWSGLFVDGTRIALLLVGALCVQLRLLCNMIDGMVAVEGGKGSSDGPVWNELPDRISDIAILAGAGYGAFWAGQGDSALGWAAASFAVVTAYVRELGRAVGAPPDYSGPMAKPHRMAAITAAAVIAAFEPLWGWHGHTMVIALVIITLGSAYTAYARAARVVKYLKAKG